jgi:hypothetical protein
MDRVLANIPTNSLIEMVLVILTVKPGIAANDGKEIEQIQRELQRRGEDQFWTFGTVN